MNISYVFCVFFFPDLGAFKMDCLESFKKIRFHFNVHKSAPIVSGTLSSWWFPDITAFHTNFLMHVLE